MMVVPADEIKIWAVAAGRLCHVPGTVRGGFPAARRLGDQLRENCLTTGG